MEKRKILFIVESMGGGVFTYIVSLANELAEHFEMYVAYGIRKQTPADYQNYFDKRVHLIKVKNFQRSISPASDTRAFLEIRQIAKEVKPDVIHLHSSKAGVLGRVAFWHFKTDGRLVPLFYTPHGYSFLMKNLGAAKCFFYQLIEKFCGKSRCTSISCSEGEHQETLKLTKHAVYVYNGIDLEQLENSFGASKIKAHPFTVFTLGRICYQKCPSLFNEIVEAMPDVRFLWIGDGALRNVLTAPNIEITGWLDRKAALTKSMDADVFILTSLWEGLPISLLEAMYLKKPCVVSDVIGNHDVIHQGINGFVCRESEDFAAAIRTVQSDMTSPAAEGRQREPAVVSSAAAIRGKTAELVRAAYADVLKIYNTKVMARRYTEIYFGEGRTSEQPENMGGG